MGFLSRLPMPRPPLPGQRAALAAGLISVFALSGPAGALEATYGVSIIGLPIGTARVKAEFDAGRYKLDVQARLTGLAGMITGGRGAGSSSGTLGPGRIVTTGYAASGGNAKESRTIRMAIQGGTAAGIEIVPPIVKKPDAIPVADSHKRGITDPVSALLMPVPAGADPLSPAACNRTLAIFDGNARYDIALSHTGTRTVESEGYTGPVAVCAARYVPVSGHRDGKATRFMAENRDIETWLAPLPGRNLVVPYRISVRSEIGMVVIEARSFDTGAAALTGSTARARPARPAATAQN
jgi:hypothetical protein